jgi:hypothetical protein
MGPIEETIHRYVDRPIRSRGAMLKSAVPRSMIEIYKPDSLIVGTRGRPDSLFKSAFMGSISRYANYRSRLRHSKPVC